MNLFEAILIAIVEGITEYLPVSSTGHMIIASSLMDIHKDPFVKLYEVAIQLGAILAVVVLYWKKFINFSRWQFYVKLFIAVIPALLLGKLFAAQIDDLLESPATVAIMLLLGGIVLLFIDKVFRNPHIEKEEDIPYYRAFLIGLWQCLAMIPGVSRSAASIVGGMQQNLTRKLAAEFSFFLAVPTMFAATGYKLYENYDTITSEHMKLLVIGNVIAFFVAILAIRFFIGFLQKYGFRLFGWYRIVAGIVLLGLIWIGAID